jgi:hypothetical protein
VKVTGSLLGGTGREDCRSGRSLDRNRGPAHEHATARRPGRERYALLCASVGGEPQVALQQAALARLCAWTTSEDIEVLTYLIRHRAGQVTQRCRSLLDEVAEVLALAVETAKNDRNFGYLVEVPVGLARRVLAAATEDTEATP